MLNSIDPTRTSRPKRILQIANWLRHYLLVPLAAFCAIYITAYLTAQLSQWVYPMPQSPILACSMGASAVILFITPNSPFAKAWSLIGGHFFSALAGIGCAIYIPDTALAAAAAVSGCMIVMQLFRCMNPPGAATALAPILTPASSDALNSFFLLSPVMVNILLLVFVSFTTKRLLVHVNL